LPVCIRFADRTLIPLALQSAKNADEQEADALGVQYVSGAGYDPRGLVDFFERVQPGTADVSAARARIEELSPPPRDYIVTSSDFQRVRERVQLLNPPHRPAAPSLRN
jgi:predicted Zn-dependent protease